MVANGYICGMASTDYKTALNIIDTCKQCQSPLTHIEGRKKKEFCNTSCKAKFNYDTKKQPKYIQLSRHNEIVEGLELRIEELEEELAQNKAQEVGKGNKATGCTKKIIKEKSNAVEIVANAKMPVRVKGEEYIDFRIRIKEWEEITKKPL